MPKNHKNINDGRTRRRKWLKRLLILIGGFIVILVIGWFVLNAYINHHKQELLKTITERISENISGHLEIKDMHPALLNSFPNISVQLDSVSLVDSLYEQHHIKTISLQSVYVQINLFSLLTIHPKIRKITLHEGQIELFTLKNGYSNNYLFKPNAKDAPKKSNKTPELHLFSLENVSFIALHIPHNKRFEISCHHVDIRLRREGNQLILHSNLMLFVQQMGFNLAKGNYLDHKQVSGKLKLSYHLKKHQLVLKNQDLQIDHTHFRIDALFDFSPVKSHFSLRLKTASILYQNGIALLPNALSKKLSKVEVQKPISVSTVINGTFQYPDTPSVKVFVKIRNNKIKSSYGIFSEVSCAASFSNYLKNGKGKGDANSGIFIEKLNGNWRDMPIHADSIIVENLSHPKLKAKIKGHFPASKLNQLVGHSFAITNGDVQFSLAYNGPVKVEDTTSRSLNGYLLVKNAALTYLPRALKFYHCDAALVFQGNDLLIKTMQMNLGQQTNIAIRGKATDFLSAYFSGGQKMVIDCTVNSPSLNLNDLKPLLSSRKGIAINHQANGKKINAFNLKLENLLVQSVMTLHMNIDELIYNKFLAHQIKATLQFEQKGIALKNASLNLANGHADITGLMTQSPSSNYFTVKANLEQLKIDKLFRAFNNFNQEALEAQNLKGQFSAKAQLNGQLNKQAMLIPGSLNGQVNFDIQDGELNNFPPFLSISKFAFKNRHLDSITFKTLKNDLSIEQGKIYIPPMDILSSAIFITVQGIYGFQHGTDISLKIPLRNPQKNKERMAQGLKPKRHKGIVVYLRAKEGADGKVHIGWDPLHKRFARDTASYQEPKTKRHPVFK